MALKDRTLLDCSNIIGPPGGHLNKKEKGPGLFDPGPCGSHKELQSRLLPVESAKPCHPVVSVVPHSAEHLVPGLVVRDLVHHVILLDDVFDATSLFDEIHEVVVVEHSDE